MLDMIDNVFWLYLLGGTGILYAVNWFVSRRSKRTVYRISNDSLAKSKQVMIRLLNIVEDEKTTPLDERSLPFEREQIKSAAKILAYFYLKQRLPEDYRRVKAGFIALSRFQNMEHAELRQEAQMKKEAKQLKREFEIYIRRSPACESPAMADAEVCTMVEAESEQGARSRD